MTNNKIQQAAKEVGAAIDVPILGRHDYMIFTTGELERFVADIEKRTIERCAAVCDVEWNGDSDTYEYSIAANECAAAIRELGEQ